MLCDPTLLIRKLRPEESWALAQVALIVGIEPGFDQAGLTLEFALNRHSLLLLLLLCCALSRGVYILVGQTDIF